MAQCTVSVTLRDKSLIHSHCHYDIFKDVTVKENDYVVNRTSGTDHSAPYLQRHLYSLYTGRCDDSSQLRKYENEHFKGGGLDMKLGKGLREYNENK